MDLGIGYDPQSGQSATPAREKFDVSDVVEFV